MKTELKTNPFKAISLALVAIVLIALVCSTISSSGENRRLKRAINDNLIQIKRLESEKNTILQSLEKDSLSIIAKDAIILVLTKKEDSLINTLNIFKHERSKIINHYLNADVSKRIDIFAKLATETDSIR
jgi:uncharacterized protein (DUF2384 family)